MNNNYFTDSIIYSLKVIFPKISHKDNIIETESPNTSNIFFSSKMCAIPEDMDCIKLLDKSTNNKDKYLTLKIIQKDDYININTPPHSRLPMFIYRILPPKYVTQFLTNHVYQVQSLKNQTLQFDHPQMIMLKQIEVHFQFG